MHWERNDKLLLESYEEEGELANEIYNEEKFVDASEQYDDFINSVDNIELHILENAMEAMDVDLWEERKEDAMKVL